MSHVAYTSPLVLEPRRSRYLLIYLFLVHALALTVLVMPINLSWILRVAIAVVVTINLVWHLRRRLPRRLVWESDGDWQLLMANGTEVTGHLRPDTYVFRLLVILRIKLEPGGCTSVVIFPDMLDSQSFRRLRVRLFQTRLAEATEDTAV